MKVYAVINDLYYYENADCPIYGLFRDREDAEKLLMKKAEEDFERNLVAQEDRKYEYNLKGLWYIHDDSRGDVSWYIHESEVQ